MDARGLEDMLDLVSLIESPSTLMSTEDDDFSRLRLEDHMFPQE
jgi:hypothetical protein